MQKVISTIMLTVVLAVTTFHSPRSEALVGLIFKKKIVKVIGGIGALGGATLGVSGLAVATSSTATLGSAIGGAILIVYGIALGGIGLIILDDDTLADVEFRKISLDNPVDYEGFSAAEVEIYNSEIDLLNSIRQSIIAEVDESEDTAGAEKLWLQYADNLSPETFEIAKAQAKKFVEAL